MIKRIENIRKILNSDTAALILSEPNRFYLTGFDTSDGAVIITEKSAVFFTDFRYIEKAKETVKHLDVLMLTSRKEQIGEILKKDKISKLYIESNYVNIDEFESLKNDLDAEIITDSKLSDALTDSRAVKDENELSSIIKAQELTDKTFEYILNKISPGKTEREIMLDMEFFMRKSGSEGVSFDFIVVSGKNSSLPHGVPTDKVIENGDFVTMDFGAVVNGYRSDMTRTVAVGGVSDEQLKVYETVLKAQEAALSFAKAGVVCQSVDKLSRDIIYNSGYKGCFGHSLGHSVGIEIHESPSFSPRCETVLKSGNIMTVEPGIYIENKFGVRIEDMIYITDSGNINLTKSPKNLIVL